MKKIALITGATSGIGRACAVKLAQNNYDVIITGRRNERLQELEKEYPQTYGPVTFEYTNDEGVRQTITSKEKVRIGNTGKKRSAEAIEKSRLGHIGLKRTEETKERMKQAQRARREKEQK